jgi:hypothetical protein
MQLAIPYTLDDVQPPAEEAVERARTLFRNAGLTVY